MFKTWGRTRIQIGIIAIPIHNNGAAMLQKCRIADEINAAWRFSQYSWTVHSESFAYDTS